MAETAVSFASGEVVQTLKEETKLLRGIHKDFSEIRDELENIQAFLKSCLEGLQMKQTSMME